MSCGSSELDALPNTLASPLEILTLCLRSVSGCVIFAPPPMVGRSLLGVPHCNYQYEFKA